MNIFIGNLSRVIGSILTLVLLALVVAAVFVTLICFAPSASRPVVDWKAPVKMTLPLPKAPAVTEAVPLYAPPRLKATLPAMTLNPETIPVETTPPVARRIELGDAVRLPRNP